MHIVSQYEGPTPNGVDLNALHRKNSKLMTSCDLKNEVMSSKNELGLKNAQMHIVSQYEGPTPNGVGLNALHRLCHRRRRRRPR